MEPILKHFRAAPLSSGLMAFSILGLLITAVYFKRFGPTWGFTFFLIFTLIFIACLISMRRAPVEALIEADHHIKHSHKKIVSKVR